MNSSDEKKTIDKGGLSLRPGVLLTKHEYTLAVSATLIDVIAIFGRYTKLNVTFLSMTKKCVFCGDCFVIQR